MKKQHRPRFFVGIVEIGDFTLRLSQGLRELGFQVTNVVDELHSGLLVREHSHDRYIPRKRNKLLHYTIRLLELPRQALRHDIFVFNFSQTFMTPLLFTSPKWLHRLAGFDLWLLRRLGKKTVVVVSGSDLRSLPLLVETMKEEGLGQHARYLAEIDLMLKYEEAKHRKARLIEEYADHIFARPISAQFLNRHYHPCWMPIDLGGIEFSISTDPVPLVIHAPSRRDIKGTRYVLEAVKRLQEERQSFRFELCENLSNVEVRKKLTQSQIAIDQLILPGYGFFAIEAMASGNAVLGSAVPGYNDYSDDLPILTTTPDTIYSRLKRLLGDAALRADLARRGRKYVEEYHDHLTVARDFVNKIGQGHHLSEHVGLADCPRPSPNFADAVRIDCRPREDMVALAICPAVDARSGVSLFGTQLRTSS